MSEEKENNQEIDWRRVLRDSSPETRRVARMWLYYTLFYWLIPTAIVVVGLLIARQPIQPIQLVIHGEFLIYAITLTAGSTRLISKDVPKSGPFVNRQAFNLWAQVMVFPAIFMYGLLRYMGSTPSPNGINTPLIVTYSVILLIGAFAFSYVVFVIDVQRTAQTEGDVQNRASQAIEHSKDTLISDFDEIQKQEAAAAPVAAILIVEEEHTEVAPDEIVDAKSTDTPTVLEKEFDELEDGQS
jgi:hypothetical protein